ncbi:hypothetical protein [Halodesulfovibrio marinisediminis]|uniref:Uncharacterized protein n=1 Tax=Halodesulfovibrio marinisediminis DSM 17456 TaxID=1121457 RepID=A0A1N6DNS0_9BACT|nr:hypothetical protein [Halodesulfovibrio marinisediminis]SIN72386.1 hypothetical protein SAMN02745161_0348 [Halodesulfovibrio marinisediminis DSM 17456]
MNKLLAALLIFFACSAAHSISFAGVYGDELTKCLVQSATKEDRVALATWMGVLLAQHSKVSQHVRTSYSDLVDTTNSAVDSVTRLTFQICENEARQAMKYEGAEAYKKSFQYFGTIAIQELMTDPSVSKAMFLYQKSVEEKVNLMVKKSQKSK